MTTVVVGGAIANKAGSAGEAWVRLSWAEGFAALGFDVLLLEQLEPGAPPGAEQWFDEVVQSFGWTDRAALLLPGTPVPERVRATIADAALLVNISGHLDPFGAVSSIPCKAYVDIDPGFTQLWEATGVGGARLEEHDAYLTIGENLPDGSTFVPMLGLEWWPTRQPVVLDRWPVTPPVACDRLTTIGNWRGPFGPIDYEGRRLGLKLHEFRKIVDLPALVRDELGSRSPAFELAMAIHPADGGDRSRLEDAGWIVRDPAEVVATPRAFADYVSSSAGELSVAQGVYVDTRCGWFSDRSVRYLAAGRPVVVQDTGFAKNIPVGDGVLQFDSVDGAGAGVCDLVDRYAHHCAAARRIAEEHFDAPVVLGPICERVGIAP